jgi:hypothetical protein
MGSIVMCQLQDQLCDSEGVSSLLLLGIIFRVGLYEVCQKSLAPSFTRRSLASQFSDVMVVCLRERSCQYVTQMLTNITVASLYSGCCNKAITGRRRSTCYENGDCVTTVRKQYSSPMMSSESHTNVFFNNGCHSVAKTTSLSILNKNC